MTDTQVTRIKTYSEEKKMGTTKFQNVKKSLVLLMAALIVVVGVLSYPAQSVKAYATPRLVVTGADIQGGSVKAGDDFSMVLHLKNESTYKLVNISLKVSSEDNQIITSSGSDSIYIEEIPREEEMDVTVDLKTRGNLEQKNYSVKVEYTYEDNSWDTYNDSASITVPVVQDSKASITEKRLTKTEVEVNGKTSLSYKINNTGKGSIYNVTSEITGDTISDISTYSGTIAVGESGTVDLSITGVKAGEGKINVKVTYEDAEGKTNTVTDTFDITVKEPVVETVVEDVPETNSSMLIAGAIIAVLVLIIIVGAIKRARDKRFE